ncbi:MAG TPA: pyruvate kinase [Betaproteobacteria bacterium]|nr:pyruvate kinase [Betaproteobacteria bacterium]
MTHSPDRRADVADLRALLNQLVELRIDAEQRAGIRLEHFKADFPHGRFSLSAANLAHYLALRQQDLRPLQERLAQAGLSSLGRGEAHALDNLDRIIELLCRVARAAPPTFVRTTAVTLSAGTRLLEQHADHLFGPAQAERSVRIMVTLPGGAAEDYALVASLLTHGMDCARINCAYDDQSVWARIIGNIRRAEHKTGRRCRILMDLAGQKIRTGPIQAGPPIRHLKVERDICGAVTRPAAVRLAADPDAAEALDNAAGVSTSQFGIPAKFHARLAPGDRLHFTDTRDKRRYLNITERTPDGRLLAQCWQSAYLAAHTTLTWQRRGKGQHYRSRGRFPLAAFRGDTVEIRLFRGDPLLLTPDRSPGRPALCGSDGGILQPARVGCSHGGIVTTLQPKQSVWIDDGKLGATVESVSPDGALLRVTNAGPQGVVIRADKGLNFPETELTLPPLTAKDRTDLDFICRHSDMVGFSFVQRREDMEQLMEQLARRDAARLPIIAKIETAKAVRNLPEIILGAMGRATLGIMIARGDLAVELGSVRLAEIQEEILWLCEAAHIPVIWATQVLETMAKRGTRSRPELTDAAMGVRAECVMLNKGPYILDALRVLNNILSRMEAHQHKKISRLRALHW